MAPQLLAEFSNIKQNQNRFIRSWVVPRIRTDRWTDGAILISAPQGSERVKKNVIALFIRKVWKMNTQVQPTDCKLRGQVSIDKFVQVSVACVLSVEDKRYVYEEQK
jgi:hypothetical protein